MRIKQSTSPYQGLCKRQGSCTTVMHHLKHTPELGGGEGSRVGRRPKQAAQLSLQPACSGSPLPQGILPSTSEQNKFLQVLVDCRLNREGGRGEEEAAPLMLPEHGFQPWGSHLQQNSCAHSVAQPGTHKKAFCSNWRLLVQLLYQLPSSHKNAKPAFCTQLAFCSQEQLPPWNCLKSALLRPECSSPLHKKRWGKTILALFALQASLGGKRSPHGICCSSGSEVNQITRTNVAKNVGVPLGCIQIIPFLHSCNYWQLFHPKNKIHLVQGLLQHKLFPMYWSRQWPGGGLRNKQSINTQKLETLCVLQTDAFHSNSFIIIIFFWSVTQQF